jgi:hydroxyacylglutathione hydrolase
LLTHFHRDHTGGLPALMSRYERLTVYAHEIDAKRVSEQVRFVEDGQRFAVAGSELEVLFVPGHTKGSVAFLWQDAVFTGDTLFGAGCGRVFEGTPTQMFDSLMRLMTLPNETRVYSGHEYTLQNLAFAAHLEPDNVEVRRRIEWATAERDAGRGTVPSTMAEELRTNPFLRCDLPEFALRVSKTGTTDPARFFAELRRRKDGFRG